MTNQYLKMAVKNLRARSLRSWLTIMGLVIGIFLVVFLISLSEGLKESVTKELRMMGGDLIIIIPAEDILTSMVGGGKLTNSDLAAIERARGVESVLPMPWAMEAIKHHSGVETTFLTGVYLDHRVNILREDMGWTTTEGEFLKPGRREVIIGAIVPKEIFPEIRVGDEITIKGRRFTVSGILRSLGNRQDDSMIIMDINDFRSVTGQREGAQMAMAKVSPEFEVAGVVGNITESLNETRERRAGDDSPSFSVLTSDTVSDMVDGVLGIIQTAILAFASIAIIVGGIGIMNTMFTSVKERTKEIGILKAIGAKRKHITTIFLFESAIIGLIGGVGGVILGIGLSKGIEFVLGQDPYLHIQAHISPALVIFGLLFSILIGSISGYFPARSASKLEPVDALRYE